MIKIMPFTLRLGDMVLVIGIDEDARPEWPRPGAIGEIAVPCPCRLVEFAEAYKVWFSGRREGCYRRHQLKKIEPPAEPIANKTTTEVTV